MKSIKMTKKEIIEYVKKNLDYFSKFSNITCEEIGDGNINYVFKLEDKKNLKSLIVKQADIFLRSSGRILDLDRNRIEKKTLEIFYKLYEGSVPKVYLYDKEKSLIIMEDISSYKNLRKELLEDKFYSHLPESISEFIYRILLSTTDLIMSRDKKKLLVKDFINPELCDISEDLVFTEAYYNYKNRNIISEGLEDFVEKNLYNNEKLQAEVLKLKDKFQNQSQALLHGDLHLGSIFVNDKGIKVIDPEFAFYGPIGYDIGNIWGNLFFPLTNAYILKKDEDIIIKLRKLIIETIDKTINKLYMAYDNFVLDKFYKNKDFKNYYIKNIISDSFGYAGTEIIRRDVGDTKVIEIYSIKEKDIRLKLDKILIEIGIFLVMNRIEIVSGEELIKSYDKILEKYL